MKILESIVDHLNTKNGKNKEHMHRVVVSVYMGVIASAMRVTIKLQGSSPMPCNVYGLVTAPSGAGKNYSVDMVEDIMLSGFKTKFDALLRLKRESLVHDKEQKLSESFPDDDDTHQKAEAAIPQICSLDFPNDSATSAGIRAFREVSQMYGMSSLVLVVDEIGSALGNIADELKEFLTMYGSGQLKGKLIKGGSDNKINYSDGTSVPTNLLLFGTASKLLDGGQTENKFKEWLETGYGRRLLVAHLEESIDEDSRTAEEMYADLLVEDSSLDIDLQVSRLADVRNIGRIIGMSQEVEINMLKYKVYCTLRAKDFPRALEYYATEMANRAYKMIKLAGAYAFVEGYDNIEQEHLDAAIDIIEIGGKHYQKIMVSDHSYVRLAKFIADIRKPVTIPDMLLALPSLPRSHNKVKEELKLAVDWGRSNNLAIIVTLEGFTESYSCSPLEETDPDKLIISYSKLAGHNYKEDILTWADLQRLCTTEDRNFTTTAFVDGHRNENNVKGLTNVIVLDIDGGVSISNTILMLEGFKYFIYTTKRHTKGHNRFRVCLPLSHAIDFKGAMYKRFMLMVGRWLPFNDLATTQRSRKWACNNVNSETFRGEGILIRTADLIPSTPTVQEREVFLSKGKNIGNLERWFSMNVGENGRNNTLYRYIRVLTNLGDDVTSIKQKVTNLNKTFQTPLLVSELKETVFKSLDTLT